MTQKIPLFAEEWIYGKWSVKGQADIHMHECDEVMLVWGLLRLTLVSLRSHITSVVPPLNIPLP